MYTTSKEVMFRGDFNIDMLTENESSAGSIYSLSNFCDQFCLTNTISVPTRVTASAKTLLDVILVSHPVHLFIYTFIHSSIYPSIHFLFFFFHLRRGGGRFGGIASLVFIGEESVDQGEWKGGSTSF